MCLGAGDVHQRSVQASWIQVLAIAVRFKPCDQFENLAVGARGRQCIRDYVL